MAGISLNNNSKNPLKLIFIHFLALLFSAFLAALVFSSTVWAKNVYLSHTLIELVCIFIAAATFLITWSTREENLRTIYIIGFGFLAVSIFDALHTYYFFATRLFNLGYPDLQARFWMAARLVQSGVLTAVSIKFSVARINRWRSLFLTFLFVFSVSYIIIKFPWLLPALTIDLDTEIILTPTKMLLESTVILLSLVTLYNIKNNVDKEHILSYRYLFTAILLIIPAELCFAIFKTTSPLYVTWGHILKVLSFYYFYKGIFLSVVTYPYERIKAEKRSRQEAYERLEQANRELEELYTHTTNLLNKIPVGIIIYNKDTMLSFMNEKAESLTGYAYDELKGLTAGEIAGILYKSYEKPQKAIIKYLYDSLDSVKNIMRVFTSKQGKKVKIRVDAYRLEGGNYLYLFDEAKKEQELKNLHLQTQTILNAIDKPVRITDRSNRIIQCNKSYAEAVEISEKDLKAMTIEKLNKMLHVTIEKEYTGSADGAPCGSDFVISFISARGNKKEWLCTTSPIYNVDGELLGRIDVASDITELKKQQLKIQHQEKLALIGQTAAGIVHEIKNPLSVIKGFSQIIKSKLEDKKMIQYLQMLENSADDINRVANEFLNLAKPGSISIREFSLNSIVESMSILLESHIHTRGINTDFSLTKREALVEGDENQLKQVLLNICENAVQAMEGIDTPILKIHTEANDIKKEALISVSDNGNGMPPEVKNRIGTPFFTTKEKGTGLGMSICHQIINQHNGRIEIDSEPGRGSTFKIILPLKVNENDKKVSVS